MAKVKFNIKSTLTRGVGASILLCSLIVGSSEGVRRVKIQGSSDWSFPLVSSTL